MFLCDERRLRVCSSLVSVRAVVQSPRLRLLDQELRLPELHLGVPTTARVTLLNSSTFLPLRFSWKVYCH